MRILVPVVLAMSLAVVSTPASAIITTVFSTGGVPSTGCPTSVPAGKGSPRNLPCCTDPAYNPGVDGVKCYGPVSSFQLTIRQFGFLRDDGEKFLFGTERTFDLASASAGADVGAFASNAVLPAGRYTNVVFDVKRNVQLAVNIRIANGRRCTLNTTFPIVGEDPGTPACSAGLPSLATPECLDGVYGKSIPDNEINVTYDPARGMNVGFGFYLDNGALCDFSGSGDVTAQYYDMPVIIRATAN